MAEKAHFSGARACARATHLVKRIGCKGHKKRCKGLWCVQGPHLLPLYQNDKQYNLVQGPLICARALAPLFVALAHGPCTSSRGTCTGPCPRKMCLFGHLSGSTQCVAYNSDMKWPIRTNLVSITFAKTHKKRLIRKVGEQVSAFNTNVVRVELARVCLNFSLLPQKLK